MKKPNHLSAAFFVIAAIAFLMILPGCANKEVVTGCLTGHTYGFWAGLWHGIIAPIDLIAMIWRDDVSVYAVNNNGLWYACGFVIGSGGWGFLGGHGASRRHRKD
jgi:hypothetical protein